MTGLDPQVQIRIIEYAKELAKIRDYVNNTPEVRISAALKGFDEAYKALVKTVTSE
jgi:hypothetical protein